MSTGDAARVALVLSGGGARGAYQVGALRAVAERFGPQGIGIVSGSSIGAVNGAVMAEGIEAGNLEGALAVLEQEWLSLSGLLRFNWRALLRASWRLVVHGPSPLVLQAIDSLLDGEVVVRRLCRFLPPRRRMGDFRRVDLVVTATDLNEGVTHAFDRTQPDVRVLDAVLASSAFPGVFASRRIGLSWYVDGGIFDNAPLDQAIRRGATDIVLIGTAPRCGEGAPGYESGPFADVYAVMRRLWPLMLDRLLYGDLRKALLVSEIVSIIEESPDPDSPVMRRLKRAIGYESAGRRKRALRIVPICPPEGVEAPGTFGFGESRAIASLMRQGYDDAHRILAQQRPAGPAGTAVRAT